MGSGKVAPGAVRIDSKSVFEVKQSRLGIGVFNRLLLDQEARRFRQAWEMEAMPGFEDFQLDPGRVSFVARPEQVASAWETIDRLLATASEKAKKASQAVEKLTGI
ncbi:MAG: hypothetical protein ACRD3M_17325 [Thermoanaerobaculia bacterium]